MQDDGKKISIPSKVGDVPFIVWLGGLSMAGGLVALSLLYSDKSDKVTFLEQKLTETQIVYGSEIDSLSDELKKVTAEYNDLINERETLGDNLEMEKAKTSRLASANAALVTRETQYKNNFNSLLSTSNKINEDNLKLKNEADALRGEMSRLKDKLAESNRANAEKMAKLDEQNKKIDSAVTAAAELRDSVKQEDVSGYFNNTEFDGAIGLFETNAPYAHYFYGITTVNGYVINKHFLTGIGVGLNRYDSGWMIPLYLDFRYSFTRNKFTPYIFADGGFQFDIENFKLPNSVFMNPGVGVYKIITNRLALNLGAGVLVQQYDFRSAFINFKLGIFFKK